MKCFKNAAVYVEGEGIRKTCLSFGERTADISGATDDCEVIDIPEDSVVLPAFIDEHIHGAGGADVMDADKKALGTICKKLAEEGTAYFLATTMTQSEEKICAALSVAAEYVGMGEKTGAQILGVHLEGPFISPRHVGAQPADFVKKPDISAFGRFDAAARGNIKIVSLAPEEDGAEELIRYLSEKGISVSLGHTDAAYDDVLNAVNCGADCVTHTFNAQRGIHHREIGTAGAALLADELYAEAIADGYHVSRPALKLLFKCKPKDKFILITDAMRAKGQGDGESELGGQRVFVKDGQARLADGTLAGSVLKMNIAVRNAVEYLGATVEQACDFASANPARHLKMYGELGGIRVGKRASYTVLGKNFDVLYTIRDGNIIYRAQEI